MPQSDTAFFGVSLLAVAAMGIADEKTGRTRAAHLLAAAALTAVAISIRLIGIALLPAIGFTLLRYVLRRTSTRPRWLAVASAAVALVLLIGVVSAFGGGALAGYRDSALGRWTQFGLVPILFDRSIQTLETAGEAAVNLPKLRFEVIRPWLPLAGLLVLHLMLAGLTMARRITPVGVFVFVLVAILFLWPWDSYRLWMPIVPVALMHASATVRQVLAKPAGRGGWSSVVRAAAVFAIAWYAITGAAGLAWSTRISFSGAAFALRYGDAGGLATPGFERANREHNSSAIMILRRYDPRQAEMRFGPVSGTPRSSSQR
jgi:hypothetical protein